MFNDLLSFCKSRRWWFPPQDLRTITGLTVPWLVSELGVKKLLVGVRDAKGTKRLGVKKLRKMSGAIRHLCNG